MTEPASRPELLPEPVNLGRLGVWTSTMEGQPIERIRDAATEIDELGYGALWFGEFGGRESFTQSAVLLAATSRLTVATGITQIGFRSPLTTATAQLTLAQAYPGRFLLGLGGTVASDQPLVPGLIPQAGQPRPVDRVRAYLDELDAAAATAATLIPVAHRPRRLLGALGPAMVRLAGTRADGAHTYLVTPDHTASTREALGRNGVLAVEQAVVLDRDPAVAARLAREHLSPYVGLITHTQHNLRRLGFTDADLADGGSDRLVAALVVGPNETDPVAAVAKRVTEHFDAGADHVCLQVFTADPGRIPLAELRELAHLTR